MCILAVKPRGIAIPSDETLRQMFRHNSDGAGISYNLNGKIILKKGLMSVDQFIKAVHSIPTTSTALIHCRITTSGGTNEHCTHPFRLCDDTKVMGRIKDCFNGYAVGHNGIFSFLDTKTRVGVNDTMIFIQNYLNPLSSVAKDNLLDDSLEPIINKLVTGSRLAILKDDGTYKKYGDGWKYSDGIYYSNDTYMDYTGKYDCNSHWWEDDEYYYTSDGWRYDKSENRWFESSKKSVEKQIIDLYNKYPDYACAIDYHLDNGFEPSVIKSWIERKMIDFYGDFYNDGKVEPVETNVEEVIDGQVKVDDLVEETPKE
jgi:hypothetical protein